MGWSLSWIGFEGLSRAEVMERAGLVEGEGGGFVIGELGNGWTVLVADEFDYASFPRLAALSAGIRAISVQVEDHVMVSSGAGYADGARIWALARDPEDGADDLDVEGEPPAELAAILARLRDEQQASDEEDDGMPVDHLYDAPAELGKALTGFRHDEDDYEGDPRFISARRVSRGRDPLDQSWEKSWKTVRQGVDRSPREATASRPSPASPPTPAEILPRRLARVGVLAAAYGVAWGFVFLGAAAFTPGPEARDMAGVGAGTLIIFLMAGWAIWAKQMIWASGLVCLSACVVVVAAAGELRIGDWLSAASVISAIAGLVGLVGSLWLWRIRDRAARLD